MIVIFKRVRIEVRSGFNIQSSQEWRYKWFSSSNELGALKLKRVKNKGIRGFKV